MRPATHPNALRVQRLLGPRFEVVEFEASTRTAAEAAAIGCAVGQIAKALVFRTFNIAMSALLAAPAAVTGPAVTTHAR